MRGLTIGRRAQTGIAEAWDAVRRALPAALLCTVLGTAGVLGSRALAHAYGMDNAYAVRDPAAVTDALWFVGIQSTVGGLLWFCGAAVCLFGGTLLRRAPDARREVGFLLASGLFSLWLGLDDVFMFHDELLPLAGIPEAVPYALYLVLGALYVPRFWRVILRTKCLLLVGAGVGLGTSLIIDQFFDSHFFEDGTKFYGIVFWAAYLWDAAATLLIEAFAPDRATR